MKILFLVILISLSGYTVAEETNRSQVSSAPETARFEIIQSELAAKITLKIDKYTGLVYQLVKGEKGVLWQLIASEKHAHDTVKKGKVNYQVFTSGIAVRMTYLINVNTGATWQLSEDSKIGVFWAALE